MGGGLDDVKASFAMTEAGLATIWVNNEPFTSILEEKLLICFPVLRFGIPFVLLYRLFNVKMVRPMNPPFLLTHGR